MIVSYQVNNYRTVIRISIILLFAAVVSGAYNDITLIQANSIIVVRAQCNLISCSLHFFRTVFLQP